MFCFQVGPAVTFSETCNDPISPPPGLGQHTHQVLSNVLGYSNETIDKLMRDQIIE
jgi:crotonobetainyl-CoA:carnitine CoA-transferase CaiB-like acyl-CoA transferase